MDAESRDSSSSGSDPDVSRPVTMETTPHPDPLPPGAPSPPELRLVLLGRKGAGKTWVVRTILDGGAGGPATPTEECALRGAEVGGRRVTVVDTPGWEWYYPLNGTPHWVGRETLRSVTLCGPGPHALLLVVRGAAALSHSFLRQVAQQLEPLGPDAWAHALLLFTQRTEPRAAAAALERRISGGGGRGLRELLERCGNRYHVLDGGAGGDGGAQVRRLLEKVAEMAQRGGHLVAGSVTLRILGEDQERRAKERRRRQRHQEEQAQRDVMRADLSRDCVQESPEEQRSASSPRRPPRLPEVRLLLLGERETGKSSAANAILGGGVFRTGVPTEECARGQAAAAGGRRVAVVDTPGWEAGAAGPTPERVLRALLQGPALCPPGPHAVLLALRADTEVRAAPVREHLAPLGEGVWRHALLLLTHTDRLREDVGIEQHVASGGRDLRWLLERCGGRYHAIGGGGAAAAQVTALLDKVEIMAAGNRCAAFSSLVQEVQEVGDLRRRRCVALGRRLAEERERARRREEELRRTLEAGARGRRWFLHLKRRSRPPARGDAAGKEEGEIDGDAAQGGTDGEEEEERVPWLTEEQEREQQELRAERDAALAALQLGEQEQREAAGRLQQREEDVRQLRRRGEEQRLELLDLQEAGVEEEQERRRWEEEAAEAGARAEQCQRESAELTEEVGNLRAGLAEVRLRRKSDCRRWEEQERRRTEEKEEAMSVAQSDTEKRIQDKDREVEEVREEKVLAEEDKERRLGEMRSQLREAQSEEERLRRSHQEQLGRALQEKESLEEELRREHSHAVRLLQERLRDHREAFLKARTEMEQRLEASRGEVEEGRQRLKEAEDSLEESEKLRLAGRLEAEELRRRWREMSEALRRKEEEGRQAALDQEAAEARRCAAREQEVEAFRLHMEAELVQKLQEKEFKMEQQLQARERETEQMREQMDATLNKNLQEKELEMARSLQAKEQLKVQMEANLNKRLQDKETEVVQRLETTAREKENLKVQMVADLNQRLQGKELEMAQKLQEKVREMEEMKLQMAAELTQRLQGKELEVVQRLKAKEQEGEGLSLQMVTDLNHQLQQKELAMAHQIQAVEQGKEDLKLQMEAQLHRKLQEKETEVALRLQSAEEQKLQMLAELNRRLLEKDSESEDLRRRAQGREEERDQERRRREEERSRLLDLNTQEVGRTQRAMADGLKELHEAKATCANLQQKVKQLDEQHGHMVAVALDTGRQHGQVLREKEAEIERWRDRQRDLCEENAVLRRSMETTKSELKALGAQLELQMERMLSEHQKELAEMNRHHQEVAGEVENLRGRCEEREREREAEGVLRRSMEEEMAELSARCLELANAAAVSSTQVGALEELNRTLRVEVQRLSEEVREEKQEAQRRAEEEQSLRAKERELDRWLQDLEVKQRELSVHGEDLQTKVRQVKTWAGELQGREEQLRTEEQLRREERELLEEQDRAAAEWQQLHQIRPDLAQAQERIQDLREADTGREVGHPERKWIAADGQEDGGHGSKERSTDSDDVDHSGETATEDKSQRPETPDRSSLDPKVLGEPETASPHRPHLGGKEEEEGPSELRVLVLGEACSSRSSTGLRILGADAAAATEGGTVWRGEIAGRHLAVSEPVGLRWRDGPAGGGGAALRQRQRVLGGAAAFGPWRRPHVVLVVVSAHVACTPAYRRAAEGAVDALEEGEGGWAWPRTLLLLTWPEALEESAARHLGRPGELAAMLERCGHRCHVVNTRAARGSIERLLLNMEAVAAAAARAAL